MSGGRGASDTILDADSDGRYTLTPMTTVMVECNKVLTTCDASTEVKYQQQSMLRYKKDVSNTLCKTKRRGPKRAFQFPPWHITKMHKKRQAQNIFLYGKRT